MSEISQRVWVVPGVFAGLLYSLSLGLVLYFGPHALIAIPVGFGTLAAIAWLTEYLNYLRWQVLDREEQRMRILAQTADSQLAERMRELASQSPELAAEVARRIGRPDLILLPMMQGRQPQIIIAGSKIRLSFALHVLAHSTDVSMTPMRNYDEGTFHFDPNHEINDRAQWVQLNWLLSQHAMCTRYIQGAKVNQAPQWLPPWSPAKILQNWLFGELLDELRPYLEVADGKE